MGDVAVQGKPIQRASRQPPGHFLFAECGTRTAYRAKQNGLSRFWERPSECSEF
jgi:hypothetical protein